MKKSPQTEGMIFLTISSMAFMVSGYLINILLGRFLGPVDYGIFGVIISIVSIINIVQTAGIPQAVSKYISENPADNEIILSSGLILQVFSTLMITVLFILLAPVIAQLLNDPKLTNYLIYSAFIFPAYGILSFYTGFYNGLHRFKKQSLLYTVYSIVKFITLIPLAYYFRINGVISAFIIAPFVTIFLGLRLPNKWNNRFSYKKILLFSAPLIGLAFFSTLQQSVDLYFVKALMHTNESAGFYTANQNIARIPYFALGAFAAVIFPSISKSVGENSHQVSKELIEKSLRMILLLIIPATFIISSTSTLLISLLYSNAYISASNSLSILIFGFAFITIFSFLSNIVSGAGDPVRPLIISVISVILTSLLSYTLIPVYKLNGAALATSIGSLFATISCALLVYQRFKVLIKVKVLLKILISSTIVYFICAFIQISPKLLPILYLFSFIFYIILLKIMNEITPDDIKYVKILIPTKLNNKYEK